MVKDRSPKALGRADVRRCGTLWVAERAASSRRAEGNAGARFRVVQAGDVEALRTAMVAAEADNPDLARLRIEGGRLGYLAEAPSRERWGAGVGAALAYGWIARAGDAISDLGFDLELPDGEAWIYDCATVPQARGKGLYTALLVTMRSEFSRYGIRRGWIGTAPRNWASQRGIARAGFLKVADMDWNGPRATVSGVPGVAPALLHLAAFSLGDGPESRVVPDAGIPVIEAELRRGAGEASTLPTDLMRFQAKYGEQIIWHDGRTEPDAADTVMLRCQGRSVAVSAAAPLEALVSALERVAPGIPWIDSAD